MIVQSKKIFIIIIVVNIALAYLGVVAKINALNNIEKYMIGKIIYIDAGHGGKDNGAQVDGVLEDSINLQISKYLLEALFDSGAYVLTSRSSDYDLADMYQKNRKREDLNNRVRYINKSNPDIFVSIHLNAFPLDDVKGAQVFYNDITNSDKLAENIQNKLNILTGKKRKTKIGDYFILNNTMVNGVIVECGFLSNKEDRNKLIDYNYQKKIAKAIKEGIVNYFYECL